MTKPEVLVIGGGMITHDQILPSLFQLQRTGLIGEISVCALQGRMVRQLAEAPVIRRAFPGQKFLGYPDTSVDPDTPYPDLYRELLAGLPPRQVVVVAVPDQLHFEVVMSSLRAGQHVLCVKPLVLKAAEGVLIEREAHERGLVVGVEYHKRFDDRSFRARRLYRDGLLGEFKLGTCCLMEKWYYRHSNFQNWCTAEYSDAFTYVGCHYVDLVHYITGLLPTAVSLYGIRDRYPNGNEGFLWCDGRVLWSNGACLNVQATLSLPDEAPGTNTQGLTMYCGGERGAMLNHSDQYRGLAYCLTSRPDSPGATIYSEPSPDYFQYNDMGGEGLVPVGYGYRSIEHIVGNCIKVNQATEGLSEEAALGLRRALLKQIDLEGVMATPANSRYNELVIEAGRLSILHGGREVVIHYGPEAFVSPREY